MYKLGKKHIVLFTSASLLVIKGASLLGHILFMPQPMESNRSRVVGFPHTHEDFWFMILSMFHRFVA